MVSIPRTVESIGLRATLFDVGRYLTSANQLTKANEQIARSNERTAAASVRADTLRRNSVFKASDAINKAQRADRDFLKAKIKAVDDLVAAQQKVDDVAAKRAAGGFKNPVQANAQLQTAQVARNRALNNLQNFDDSAAARKRADLRKDEGRAVAQGARDFKTASEIEKRAALDAYEVEKRIADERAHRRKQAIRLTAAVGAITAVAVTGAALSAAANYETSLAKIDALTSINTEDTKKFGQAALQLSTQLPVSATDILQAGYVALSSGIKDTDKAFQIATLSAKAQTAQMGEAGDFARVLTAVNNSYGESNISSAKAADVLTAAIQEGSAEAKDFVGNIGRVVGIAPKLNVQFSEVAGTIAFLTNTGLTASEATTGLLGVLNELAQESPGQIKALASIGTNFNDVKKSIRDNGLLPTLVTLNQRFDQEDESIRELFPNIRAYNAALSLTTRDGKTAAETIAATKNNFGKLDGAVLVTKDTLANTAQLLKNEVTKALIDVGTELLPTAVGAINDLRKALKENEQELKSAFVAGIKAAITILEDFINGLIIIVKGLSALNNALSGTPAQAAAAATALALIGGALLWALPGGPIIKGLILITGLIGALDKGFDTPLGKFGGTQNAATGERHLFGRATTRGEVAAQLKGESTADKILGAVTPGFLQTDEYKAAEKIVEDLKKKGITTLEQFNALTTKELLEIGAITQQEYDDVVKKTKEGNDKQLAELDKFNKKRDEESKLDAHITGDQGAKAAAAEEAKKLREELQKLAQTFKQTTEETGNLNKNSLGKLEDSRGNQIVPELDRKLADALKLTAAQAGKVQGYATLRAAIDQTNNKAYDFTRTMATVAYAFQNAASVGQTILLSLAQAALQASQAAGAAIFNRPNREQANAGVGLAGNNLNAAINRQRTNPQIDALNKQLKNIDKRIQQQQRANSAADKARQRAATQRQKAQEAAQKAIDAQLDAMQLANTIAQHNAAIQQRQLQDVIDSNNKAQSTLQDAFLKSNEALQQQINKAIGQGDEAGALALVKTQQDATKAYRSQSKTLTDQQQKNEQALKDADREESIRAREAAFQEAMFQAQTKNTQATEDNTEADQAATDAEEAQINAMEDQKTAIEDQIQALQDSNDKYDQAGARIQEYLDVLNAQIELEKAKMTAADATLLTQAEQAKLAKEFTEKIAASSLAVKSLSDSLNVSVIPEVNAARDAFFLFRGAQDASRGAFNNLIVNGLDPAAKYAEIMRLAMENNTRAVDYNSIAQETAARSIIGSARAIDKAIQDMYDAQQRERDSGSGIGIGQGGYSYALGGFTPGAITATLHPNEAIIPMSNPSRAREIIARMPASLTASMGGGGNKTSVGAIIGSLAVHGGTTLSEMRAVAVSAVNDAFGKISSTANRGGSLIEPGVSGGAKYGAIGRSGGGGGGSGRSVAGKSRSWDQGF